MDLTKMNLAELRALLDQAGRELKSREKKDIEAARNEIYAIAHRLGLPIKNVLESGSRKPTAKVAFQYSNPRNPAQQWTGRGRQPTWVKELLASGASLESARI